MEEEKVIVELRHAASSPFEFLSHFGKEKKIHKLTTKRLVFVIIWVETEFPVLNKNIVCFIFEFVFI